MGSFFAVGRGRTARTVSYDAGTEAVAIMKTLDQFSWMDICYGEEGPYAVLRCSSCSTS